MLEQIIRAALSAGRSVLLEHELFEMLEQLGLPVPQHRFLLPEQPAPDLPGRTTEMLDQLSDDEVDELLSIDTTRQGER